jgi:hypothetical protein
MNTLFTLYRYLARNKNDHPENSYTTAYRALESFLDIVEELEYWGEKVYDNGGFDWDEADRLTSRLTDGFKTALCSINDDAVKAIHDFIESHITMWSKDGVNTTAQGLLHLASWVELHRAQLEQEARTSENKQEGE